MAVKRPALLQLGGQEAFVAYRAEFDRLYRSGAVRDVLGNHVEFPTDACRHVCFKPTEEDPYGRLARDVWSQERAERIPWILVALTDPGIEVRPNPQRPDRLSYILVVDAEPLVGLPQEYFGAVCEPTRSGVVQFVTAFPMDQAYWARWRRAGRRFYPPTPRPRRKKR
jgi:hypothetical protein